MKIHSSLSTALLTAVVFALPVWAGPSSGPGMRSLSSFFSFYVEREAMRQGYVIRIHVRGVPTTAIQVTPRPGRLIIHFGNRSYRSSQGGPGPREFGMSSSHFFQTVPLPPDADLAHMQRSERAGLITLVVPRRILPGSRPLW